MWQYFTLKDVRVISHYLGVLIMFSSLMYVLPLLTAIVFGEWEPASRYLLAAGISLLAGQALRFARIQPTRLNRQQALAVTGLAWIVLALFASIPLYHSGHYLTYMDALFDGVSGLTTTGATVITDLEHLSYADNMFRFMMHLLGGLGLIVIALSLGLLGKQNGNSLYTSEARSEHVVPNVVQTTRLIARISLIFILITTLVLTFACMFKGMKATHAVLHAFWVSISGFMTGGFTPTSQSIMYYHSFPVEFFLMVIMICGAVNFALHVEVWKGHLRDFFRDLEVKTMVIWLCAMAVVIAASLSASSSFSDLPGMLRRGLFMIVSAFSTTGFMNITSNELVTVFSSGAFLTLAMMMAVGGGGGSTAGGLKLRRVGIIAKSIVATIKETLSPDSARVKVTYTHIGQQQLTQDTVKEALTVFMLFVVTYAIGALAGIAYGYEATQAIFDSVAMASNGGLATIVSPGMPGGLEVIYIFMMWAGRLEFVTLLALVVEIAVSLDPRRHRRRSSR